MPDMTVPHSLVEGKKITYISLPLSPFKMRSIADAYRTLCSITSESV